MKSLMTLVLFIVSVMTATGQLPDIDSTVRAISAEKEEDKKVELITTFYTPEFNNDPALAVKIGMRLLKQSQIDKNIIEESCAYSFLGQGYRLSGNNIKGLAYHLKAINLADKSGNLTVLAMAENQAAHIYKDRGEFEKAVQYYLSSSTHAEQGITKSVRNWPLVNLGNVYLSADKLDSSLMYSQRGHEGSFRSN
ncbi:MAG TPA: tetratricopeptide repeat protein, partial [Flavitalea sp.]|nr:tetratricopeptide repeat protein [Flavitalea sp.]